MQEQNLEIMELDNSIEKMYQANIELISNYLDTYTKTIKTKLEKSRNNLRTDQQETINELLEKLESNTYIEDIKEYLNNVSFVYWKMEDSDELKTNLTINVVPDEDYIESWALGSYDPFQERINIPESANQSTFLHELIHALTFKFDIFFLNQLSLDAGNLDLIKNTIFTTDESLKQISSLQDNIENTSIKLYLKKLSLLKTLLEDQISNNLILESIISSDISNYFTEHYDNPQWESFKSSLLKTKLDNYSKEELIDIKVWFENYKSFYTFYNSYHQYIQEIISLIENRSYLESTEKNKKKLKNITKQKELEENIKFYQENIQGNLEKIKNHYDIMSGFEEFHSHEYWRNLIIDLNDKIPELNSLSGLVTNSVSKIDEKLNKQMLDKKDNLVTKITANTYEKDLKKVNHDIYVLAQIQNDPGTGYMWAFEITARFRQLRLELYNEWIISDAGEEITIEKIEQLLQIKGDKYNTNNSYDLLEWIKLNSDGKIPKDQLNYIKTIINMNNNDIVENNNYDNSKNIW